jgi:3-methyl-2-oxobutanoate hydroxymethyltransferase
MRCLDPMDRDTKKRTVPSIKKRKGGVPIVAITAYDYVFSKIADEADVDIILVGDSAGMVFSGYENTLPVTMEEMLYHLRAVARGRKNALLIFDMPFGSYQPSIEEGIKNAVLAIKNGAEGVKIEGGEEIEELVRRLTLLGIPVMGHIGLTPQWIHSFGGYKVQGREDEKREKLKRDAKALEKAGAFSIVLEGVPAALASEITASVSIPTIGIGAGMGCDGQILVIHDVLGLFPGIRPTFVKVYENLYEKALSAIKRYAEEVREKKFPGEEHSYR